MQSLFFCLFVLACKDTGWRAVPTTPH